MALVKKMVAEFIGTLVLVLFGCGAAVGINTLLLDQGMSVPLAFSTGAIALAFGLTIVAMAYSVGTISGCNINPAVSLAMFIAKKLSAKDFFGYLVAQFAGGIAGTGLLAFFLSSTTALGQNGYGASSALGTPLLQAFGVEIVLTFVFVFAILGVTSNLENSAIAGLVIGLTLTLVHLLGIPFTGTSVNPARSFGPALFAGGEALSQVWVFLVAPLVGAALAAVVWAVLSSNKEA